MSAVETEGERQHLSIGEVLSQLQAEFPDVTISKIRFLESQGLIDPERTASGYRKFYEHDIARLTWILRQQRDNFLPLKVIKAKLDGDEIDVESENAAVQQHLFATPAAAPPRADDPPPPPWTPKAPTAAGATRAPAASAPPATTASDPTTPPEREPSPEPASAAPAGRPNDASTRHPSAGGERDAAAWLAALQESPRPGGNPVPTRPVEPAATGIPRGVRFGREEVAEVTGVDVAMLDSLVDFGLVTPWLVGGEATFDAASVAVVRAVAPFVERGVEARHLRIFKNAAEREAGFLEQMILPLLKQRNPKAREQAAETLAELADAGDALGRALVRQALRAHLGD